MVEVFEKRCQSQHATLYLAERDFQWQVLESTATGNRPHFTGCGLELHDVQVALAGRHQAANAAVALAVAALCDSKAGPYTIHTCARAWPQRAGKHAWKFSAEPLDRARCGAYHRIDHLSAPGLERTLSTSAADSGVGMAADKKVADSVATLAPIVHEVIVTRFSSPRAYDPQRLAELLQSHGLP